MKNFLKTFSLILPASENESSISATGDAITVYDTNAPFIVRDEFGSLFEIDRACRVESVGDTFGRLTLIRPPGITGEIRVRLAIGAGVKFYDGRLQYTSSTTNAPVVNIGTIDNKPLPLPPVRARFVPKHACRLNMRGEAVYTPDATAAPAIAANAAAALNLLAPASLSVTRRTVRLVSGSAAQVGFVSSAMASPGQSWTLTTANPERVIDGGEALFGSSAENCTFVITETIQPLDGSLSTFSTFAANLTAAEKSTLPAATASGEISWTFSAGATYGTGVWNGTSGDNIINAAYNAKVTKTGSTVDDTWRLAFAGITSANMSAMNSSNPTPLGLKSGVLPYSIRAHLQIGSGAGLVNFSNGQTFKIAPGGGAWGSNGSYLFRVSWVDDAAPFVERVHTVLDGGNTYVWSKAERPDLI